MANNRNIPEPLFSAIKEAPLAWGIVALNDYRSGTATAEEIAGQWAAVRGNYIASVPPVGAKKDSSPNTDKQNG